MECSSELTPDVLRDTLGFIMDCIDVLSYYHCSDGKTISRCNEESALSYYYCSVIITLKI